MGVPEHKNDLESKTRGRKTEKQCFNATFVFLIFSHVVLSDATLLYVFELHGLGFIIRYIHLRSA